MIQASHKRLIAIPAMLGAIGVIFGAFGAHALKTRIPPEALDTIKTGVLYLFIHVLAAMLAMILHGLHGQSVWLVRSARAFVAGVILFSGSLFVIGTSSLTGLHIGIFGFITPLGGLCFIAGWTLLAVWAFLRP